MSKIIIENQAGITDSEALYYARRVIEMGRISDNGKAYCYHTQYQTMQGDEVHVSAYKNKASDRFVVQSNPAQRPLPVAGSGNGLSARGRNV